MAYEGSGRFPVERASKLGHVRLIQDSRVQRLLDAFERVDESGTDTLGELSGTIDLEDSAEIENIVTVDGSHIAIPNALAQQKRLAFITVAATVLRRSEIQALRATPIIDPRELAEQLDNSSEYNVAVLPLSGVSVPGETLVYTIRRIVDEWFHYYDLYNTLSFLIFREWDEDYTVQEHMQCYKCNEEFVLPRSRLNFSCPHCQEGHTLSDYLRIVENEPQDWAREEAAINLRNVMETLLLLKFLVAYKDRHIVLRRTLFVKDGPLLLRAQLSRLIEPIRNFLKFLKEEGRSVYLVGIEKTGDLVDHIPQIGSVLRSKGDYFLPSVQYLHERVQGVPFLRETYRNRVQYGSKVVVRLGPDHVIAANIPTGDFLMDPDVADLYGFRESMTVLGEMLSYSHENALIPINLTNSVASISTHPSGDILEALAWRLLSGETR
jgi:hypothetical protein